MKVKDIMTESVAFCTPKTQLPEVARMMVDHDCGAIPVVESQDSRKPSGVITDRDICCRAVAENRNPLEMTAGDVMTRQVATVRPDADVKECEQVMEDKQHSPQPIALRGS